MPVPALTFSSGSSSPVTVVKFMVRQIHDPAERRRVAQRRSELRQDYLTRLGGGGTLLGADKGPSLERAAELVALFELSKSHVDRGHALEGDDRALKRLATLTNEALSRLFPDGCETVG